MRWTEERIRRVPERNIRIVGGSAAQPNQFRHAAALFLKLLTGDSFCGGSIIHVNFILTAAHCLDDLIQIEVVAGTTNIFRGTPPYRSVVTPNDIRQHPTYDKTTLRDDIGLVCLRTAIPTNSQMAPVALPSRNMVRTNLVDRVPLIIGWGRTSDGKFTTIFMLFLSHDCNEIFLSSKSKSFRNVTICPIASHFQPKLHKFLQHNERLLQSNEQYLHIGNSRINL